jgi:hypothetical protein
MAIDDCRCERPGGPSSAHIPNVAVETHEGRRALFYDHLVRGRVVMIHCFALADTEFPALLHMERVQDLLGDRLGRDMSILSITADPEHDTQRALRRYAQDRKLRTGWILLTGQPDTVHGLRARLFANGGGHQHGQPLVKDCSFGVIRYGNEPAGLWSACPVRTEPEGIVQRISWVSPKAKPAEPRRGGPFVGRV